MDGYGFQSKLKAFCTEIVQVGALVREICKVPAILVTYITRQYRTLCIGAR